MNDLTAAESSRLAVLEDTVFRGLSDFVNVGLALGEIRDRRLYRKTHTTWEDYCRERWHVTDRRVRQLMAAATVTKEIGESGTTGSAPTTERQARELVPLTPEQRQEVWTEATADGAQPTAARLHELANRTLAGLPPEEQQETVAQAETAVLERQAAPADEVRAGKIERALKWLMRAWAEIESLSDDTADAVLRVLDTVVSAAKALRDE